MSVANQQFHKQCDWMDLQCLLIILHRNWNCIISVTFLSTQTGQNQKKRPLWLCTMFITRVWLNVCSHCTKLRVNLMISYFTLTCENDPELLPEEQLLSPQLIGTSFPMRELLQYTHTINGSNSANGRRSSANNRGHQTGLSPDLKYASISCQWTLQTDVSTKHILDIFLVTSWCNALEKAWCNYTIATEQ